MGRILEGVLKLLPENGARCLASVLLKRGTASLAFGSIPDGRPAISGRFSFADKLNLEPIDFKGPRVGVCS